MSSFECCVVLVVDDEPTVLKTVTYALKRHGYIVIPASDGLTSAIYAPVSSGEALSI